MLDKIISTVMDMNPVNLLYKEFKEGQARDEARQVRADDIGRDQANFERNSISGRIAEGAKHGLSKLASIGSQPNNSTTAVVGQDTSHLQNQGGVNYQTADDRTSNRLQQDLLTQQIEGQRLENLKKSQELAQPKTGQPTAGAGFMPGSSQVIRNGVTEKPMERTSSFPGRPWSEPGAINAQGFEASPTGLGSIPSTDIKERIEDSPYELRHFIRYGILPNLGDMSTQPPLSALPPGADSWVWNRVFQEYQPQSLKQLALERRWRSKHNNPYGPLPQAIINDWNKNWKNTTWAERLKKRMGRGYYGK